MSAEDPRRPLSSVSAFALKPKLPRGARVRTRASAPSGMARLADVPLRPGDRRSSHLVAVRISEVRLKDRDERESASGAWNRVFHHPFILVISYAWNHFLDRTPSHCRARRRAEITAIDLRHFSCGDPPASPPRRLRRLVTTSSCSRSHVYPASMLHLRGTWAIAR